MLGSEKAAVYHRVTMVQWEVLTAEAQRAPLERMMDSTGHTLQSQELPCLPPPTIIQIVFNLLQIHLASHTFFNSHMLTGAPLFEVLASAFLANTRLHSLGCWTVVTPVTLLRTSSQFKEGEGSVGLDFCFFHCYVLKNRYAQIFTTSIKFQIYHLCFQVKLNI